MRWIRILAFLIIFVAVSAAFAQSSTATPTPPAGDVVLSTGLLSGNLPSSQPSNGTSADLVGTIELLLKTFQAAVLGAFGAAPVTTTLVSILKRIPLFASVQSQAITFGVALVIWVLAAIAEHFGFRTDFNNFLDLVTGIAPLLFAFITTTIAAHYIFNAAHAANVPIVGYSRS